MYEPRDAALNWHQHYRDHFTSNGFKQGMSSPCFFYNHNKNIQVFSHEDDYVPSGHGEDLGRCADELKNSFECKVHVLGQEKEDMKEVRVLNRILT